MTRILVIDDEASVRQSLGAFLRTCGHEVRLAAGGTEALAAMREFPAHVVLTDVNMPEMDGIEIVMALREAFSEVGVIAMSGGGLFAKEMLLDSAGALGADITLEKPMDLDQLSRAVDALVTRAEQRSGCGE